MGFEDIQKTLSLNRLSVHIRIGNEQSAWITKEKTPMQNGTVLSHAAVTVNCSFAAYRFHEYREQLFRLFSLIWRQRREHDVYRGIFRKGLRRAVTRGGDFLF